MSSNQSRAREYPTESAPVDLGVCARVLAATLARATEELFALDDLSYMECVVLRSFLEKDQWTTTELSQALPIKAPRISRLVSKLVDRGLLWRRRPRGDRRVVILALTEDGYNLAREVDHRVQAYQLRLSEAVGEKDLATFFSVASRIIDHASPHRVPTQD